MRIDKTSILADSRKSEVYRLWNAEYPKNLSYQSTSEFDKYLESLEAVDHFLLIDQTEKLKGWALSFCRENSIWFALIVDSKVQGNGYGRLLLDVLKESHPKLNGWVIDHSNEIKNDGSYYQSPMDFYLKNGFELVTDKTLKNDKLSAVMIKTINR